MIVAKLRRLPTPPADRLLAQGLLAEHDALRTILVQTERALQERLELLHAIRLAHPQTLGGFPDSARAAGRHNISCRDFRVGEEVRVVAAVRRAGAAFARPDCRSYGVRATHKELVSVVGHVDWVAGRDVGRLRQHGAGIVDVAAHHLDRVPFVWVLWVARLTWLAVAKRPQTEIMTDKVAPDAGL